MSFDLPKYRRGDTVSTPDGTGIIEALELISGHTWYLVDGKYYSESEIN